jgi:hypothetical protein
MDKNKFDQEHNVERDMNTFEPENNQINDQVEGNQRGSNRLLIGIVIGAIILIIITFAVTLLRPAPGYISDDTPDGVAHNYLHALQIGDYQRAYIYLSTTLPGYPIDLDEFTDSVEDDAYRFRLDRSTTLNIDSVNISDTRATITVGETEFRGGGIFDRDHYSRTFKMKLQLEDGEWKITDSDSYSAWCWFREEGCQ